MTKITRVFIHDDPFLPPTTAVYRRGEWPVNWVEHPNLKATPPAPVTGGFWPGLGATENPDARGKMPVVVAYRRILNLDHASKFRLHISADERYELFVDGERVGRGPERGDRYCWFYETYELDMPAGRHVIVARVWWIGADAISAHAQVSVRPAFLGAFEAGPENGKWECKQLGGYAFISPEMAWGTTAKTFITGATFDWGHERGDGAGWQPARAIGSAFAAAKTNMAPDRWWLRPATLPAMREEPRRAGTARHVQVVPTLATQELPVRAADHLPAEVAGWNRLLAGHGSLTIPARTLRRVIVDLGDYLCAYPQVTVSAGQGATVRVWWAESLLTEPYSKKWQWLKGNRDEIAGKFFTGIGDTFIADGGAHRRYEPFWWAAGRYVEIVIATADEPLTVEDIVWAETGYPYEFTGRFDFAAPGWRELVPIAERALQMCSHETYMDCPYYEQMMYVGDTRLEVLTTYALTRDDRLPRKAVQLFDESRGPSGLTQSRYPCRVPQFIPPFSLYWIGMVHDFALWRDDAEFVRARMPGVRAVLDAFVRRVNRDHLLEAVQGWNFVDWVPTWDTGMPADADRGISGVLNWHFIYTLQLAAELEDVFGEPELAARNRRLAGQIATPAFWDDRRGLYADDLAKKNFSEHAQCFAILAGDRRTKLDGPDLAQTTIYFSHYLFEASRVLGQIERVFNRMPLWFDLPRQGFRTTVESPEPSRSDCHAWGAHPIFHAFATILGIRPASFGFKSVRITPQLGPLPTARGTLPHPGGDLRVDFAINNGQLTGNVELPAGLTGELIHAGQTRPLQSGRQQV